MSLIKWQSTEFPEMILTEEHYQKLRSRIRYVESFRDELEKAELYLIRRPEKKPKKNWSRFIFNWLINADRYQQERVQKNYEQRSQQRYNAIANPVLDKMRLSKKVDEKYRCSKCGKQHSPQFQC